MRELRARAGFDTPAPLLRSVGTTVFSFGGGTGVRMGNHGFAWIGLVAGRKLWYTAPYDVQRPKDPQCSWSGEETVERLANVSHCMQ